MGFREDLHENKDLVVAVVGVIVLSVLTASMFYIEQVQLGPDGNQTGSGPLTTYQATFSNDSFQEVDLGDNATGTLNNGESVNVTVPVPRANVTAVLATLDWEPSGQQDIDPDTFSLVIFGPGGASCEDQTSGSSAPLKRTCSGVDVPADRNVSARSMADAERKIATRVPARTAATGDYHVRITLESTGNDGPVDDSNGYTLTFDVKTYVVDVTQAS